MVTVAKVRDPILRLWSVSENKCSLVHNYTGHKDSIKAFDWRTIPHLDHKHHQLVSWGSDKFLRYFLFSNRFLPSSAVS